MPRVTITVPDKKSQPYRFALERKSVTLGRGSGNDIVVDCGSISVKHAVMERIKGGYQLRDLGSTNGTKLDGKTREIVGLFDGAPVKIGDVEFGFTLTSDEVAELAKEGPADAPIVKEEESDAPSRKSDAPRRPAPQTRTPVPVSHPSGGASFLMTLLFLVLAAASFFVGMSIRHSKETGRSLTYDMKNGVPEVADPDEVVLPEPGAPVEAP
ncbi:FHA domain-containing protein [Haloferula sp.]|uniref:FHA domain-containing protein n=1 Tax=Haloferula sp. TaxID=2497595 RepID=UPI00329DA75C